MADVLLSFTKSFLLAFQEKHVTFMIKANTLFFSLLSWSKAYFSKAFFFWFFNVVSMVLRNRCFSVWKPGQNIAFHLQWFMSDYLLRLSHTFNVPFLAKVRSIEKHHGKSAAERTEMRMSNSILALLILNPSWIIAKPKQNGQKEKSTDASVFHL